MSQQEQHAAYQFNAPIPGSDTNTQVDSSTTFVKPLHEGTSQPFTPYRYTEGDIPPPPPYVYQQLPHQSQRHRGYVIALVLLALLVVGLGTLEVFQVAGGKLLAFDPNRSPGMNQSAMRSALHASLSQKATPIRALTPGTIKENVLLTCGTCDDPILTTINTITVDTTNLSLVWVVKLNNVSGSEQVDTFNDFNLQDPNGTIYTGTGKLNTVFILSAGQTVLATEIFSFLPRPGVPYTLITRLGVSGRTYDPVQFTF
jgi:hypothetical protein